MSFSQNEKETKEVNKNINEAKPITLEEYNNKKSDMTQIKEKNNSKKKILTIKNTFDLRKKHFQINKDIYRRMMKNKTQGELEHFRNNSFKKFFEVKKGLNTFKLQRDDNKFSFSIDIFVTFWVAHMLLASHRRKKKSQDK